MSVSLIVFAVIVLCAAATGGFFSPDEWYDRLNKPSWTPPGWVFPTVWTPLYIMIAIAGWLVWSAEGLGLAIAVWAVQICLNGLWSYLFFGLRRMDLALVDCGLLWLSIVAFIALAAPVSGTASLLFVPYLVWVSVAFHLNRTVWRMNALPSDPSALSQGREP